ncbi:hypothetical protein AXG93_146s1470 [Marchantia polymorpha subsp. ruderalis]|uniref:Uncharacterized protein n=1 Tax=Marchantia polymorpha subsp. ruderalis TaxID=1480154 RepID=A0A176W7V4_MARPO|nr:hypothetical protein AXG93_146s1470 [Marchantia polymorpha subsp. ruderalis]
MAGRIGDDELPYLYGDEILAYLKTVRETFRNDLDRSQQQLIPGFKQMFMKLSGLSSEIDIKELFDEDHMNEVLAFARSVKEAFHDDRGKYHLFVEILDNYKRKEIDTPMLLTNLQQLFRGHPQLIQETQKHLPRAALILSELDSSRLLDEEVDDALGYLKRVVDTVKTDDDKYQRFKDILDTYSNGRRDVPAVVAQVDSLFGGNPHLTLGFERVLHGVALLSSILSAEKLFSVNVIDALTYVRSVQDAFKREKAMYRMFLEVLKDYNTGQIDVPKLISQVKVILDGHPNLIADFHKCLPGIPHLSDLLKDN